MQPNLKQLIWQWRGIFITAPCIAGLVIAGYFTSLFQLLELATLDQFFRQRPPEVIDSRIVIVTIDESDIDYVKKWPLSDATLAKLLNKLKKQQPRAIGLDLYRNLPEPPGEKELIQVFKSTPYLIGVEKASGDKVQPSPILKDLKQVALADLVLDVDGKVRRALISIQDDNIQKLGLGPKLALRYLEAKNIKVEVNKPSFPNILGKGQQQLRLGKAIFQPFLSNDGGYVDADDGGYQILLNYRGPLKQFKTVSITEVLKDKTPANLMSDRLVFIGTVGHSIKDFVYTPYNKKGLNSPEQIPGVIVHANIASQILSAALDDRAMLQVLPKSLEFIWILTFSFIGAIVTWTILETDSFRKNLFLSVGCIFIEITITGTCLIGITYLAFLNGYWIPVIPPLVTITGSALAIATYRAQDLRRLASLDGLTQVANRRYFDEYFHRNWWKQVGNKQSISVILGDVDCFKLYNDTYGHQAGDKCLQQVAKAIRNSLRSTDLVARYGGEEFVVLLPNTNSETAIQVAERICSQVRNLKIAHTTSKASQYVTMSCGVASIISNYESSPTDLIAYADRALYCAKECGRDRAVAIHQSELF